MSVSAVIVTRGDVDLTEIIRALPSDWELVVWSNGERRCYVVDVASAHEDEAWTTWHAVKDLAVYGRYAAIEYASGDLIYVQDDDVLHRPEGILEMIETYKFIATCPEHGPMNYGSVAGHWGWVCFHADHEKAPFSPDAVVCNMPAAFRSRHFYDEHSLVGFGAVFHRSVPEKVFDELEDALLRRGKGFILEHRPQVVLSEPGPLPPASPGTVRWTEPKVLSPSDEERTELPWFWKTCDIPFTFFSSRVLVDIDYQDMPWASADNRMWKQAWHQQIRNEMLELCREVRDA